MQDATVLMKKIQESDPAYFIEGKRVSVGYAKNTPYPPPKATNLRYELISICFMNSGCRNKKEMWQTKTDMAGTRQERLRQNRHKGR